MNEFETEVLKQLRAHGLQLQALKDLLDYACMKLEEIKPSHEEQPKITISKEAIAEAEKKKEKEKEQIHWEPIHSQLITVEETVSGVTIKEEKKTKWRPSRNPAVEWCPENEANKEDVELAKVKGGEMWALYNEQYQNWSIFRKAEAKWK